MSNQVRSGAAICPFYSSSRSQINNCAWSSLPWVVNSTPHPLTHQALIISRHVWPCPGLCATSDPASIMSSFFGLADASVGHLAWDICHVSLRPSGHQQPQPAFPAPSSHPHCLLSLLCSVLSTFFDPQYFFLHVSFFFACFFCFPSTLLACQAYPLMSPAAQNKDKIQTDWKERKKKRSKTSAFYLTL